MVHILLPVENAQHISLKKRALQIQAETHCTLPAAREQAGQTPAELPAAREQAEQTLTTEPAASSFAQVLAHSQADLVNRNLALSDENARLKEVIVTLRRTNASLQQRLDGYEHRLHALEQSMVGGARPDTPLVGIQNTTSVGSAHNTTPVGSAYNSTPVGDAHNPTSVGDSSVSMANMASQTEKGNTSGPYASVSPQLLKVKRPTDAPSYIYIGNLLLPKRRWSWTGRAQAVSQWPPQSWNQQNFGIIGKIQPNNLGA